MHVCMFVYELKFTLFFSLSFFFKTATLLLIGDFDHTGATKVSNTTTSTTSTTTATSNTYIVFIE